MNNFKPYKDSGDSGFIALTVALSVTGILFALVTANSIDAALFFDQAVKKEYREMNYYYAYDCIDQAILTLAHDYFLLISPQKPLEISQFFCSILSIEARNDLRIIKTRGNFKKAYVFRSATVRLHDHDLDVVKIE